MAQTTPSRSMLTLVIALVALVLAIAALVVPYFTYANPNSLQVVNTPVQTRNILIEWGMFISTQDRFFPQILVVNQGDTIHLTFESNDTDGAHTWTISAPTGTNGALQTTQLNVTVQGQWMYFPPGQAGPQYGTKVKGSATGCMTMGQAVTCNTTGGCSIDNGAIGACTGSFLLPKGENETAAIQGSTTFGPLRAPGVYEYVCTYHQAIGMVGYLIVLPNKAYNPSA